LPRLAHNPTPRRHISLRLAPELLRFLDEQAAATFQNRSQVIQGLIAQAYQQNLKR
jgi:metal-responsive CopG/Arc/MetJ family transcriptional regulator